MLLAIKKTLLNVTKTVAFMNIEDIDQNLNRNSVTFKEAFELLSHYQYNWKAIHVSNEENGSMLNKTSETITSIHKKLETDKQNCELIIEILGSKKLKTSLVECTKCIDELYEQCDSLEKSLVDLQDLIEICQVEKKKQLHSLHLCDFKNRKMKKLESIKASLEDNYQKIIVDHDLTKKSVLQERQKSFQKAFNKDLEYYKKLGKIPKMDQSNGQNSALLEEIQLDYDENELEQFLEETASSKEKD